MAYTINLTNGNVFAVIPDGTVNTNSSMVLVGKNYAGYGEFLDENVQLTIYKKAQSLKSNLIKNPIIDNHYFNIFQ